MSQQTKNAVAVLGLVLAAGAFWLVLIAPKREKAEELSKQVAALRAEVVGARNDVAAGLAAKRNFPHDYQQLVLLGKAVPADSGTASLLVQLDDIGSHNRTEFVSIELKEGNAAGGESAEAAEEVAALPPLGSTVGPAGLRAMPYELSFVGGFFDAADFIAGMNSLVQTRNGRVRVDGRLLTFDRFEMTVPSTSLDYKELDLKFYVTAYATPVDQGLTAGASAAGPAPE